MGLLIIKGVLRTNQVWPMGQSDADTVSIDLVLQSKSPFVFVNNSGQRHVTRAFDNAESVGKHGRKPVVTKAKGSTVSKVKIRLQGIDAPELHYQPDIGKPSGGKNHRFRQSMGETCSNALFEFLSSYGSAELPCEVVSIVKKPSDVCDVFGRVVGNVVLTLGGSRIDLNHWLVREGWALPGLYNSMAKDEIRAFLADYTAAKKDKRGLFSKKIVTTSLAPFDPDRRYEKGTANFKAFSDKGPVNFPKYFRRDAEFHVRSAVGDPVPSDLFSFIKTKKDDLAMATPKFLAMTGPTTGQQAKKKFDQLAVHLGKNHFPTGPELVFFENDTRLVKAGTNTPITKW